MCKFENSHFLKQSFHAYCAVFIKALGIDDMMLCCEMHFGNYLYLATKNYLDVAKQSTPISSCNFIIRRVKRNSRPMEV